MLSILRYVDITSVVGGAAATAQRDLIARLYNQNVLTPTDAVLEFTDPVDIANYYGGDSVEYKNAVPYFSFISKSATRAKKISYSSFPLTVTPARVITGRILGTFDDLKTKLTALPAGTKPAITLGGVVTQLDPGVLTGVTSFAQYAAALQVALVAIVPSSTVVFQDSRLIFSIPNAIGVGGDTRTTGMEASQLLLLTPSTLTVDYPSSPALSIADILGRDTNNNDNFASFKFLVTLTDPQYLQVAQWLATTNFKFMWSLPSLSGASARALSDLLITFPGIAITVSPLPTEYPEILPMALLAATNFERRAANKNYMFQQMAGISAFVSDNSEANLNDAKRVNYYGITQKAGKTLAFYQKGKLTGGTKDATDINIYVNEVWFKDYITSLLMNMFIALEAVPANDTGRGYVLANLQTAIDLALINGVISVGKPLTITQQTYIQEQTGDPLAWLQVQNSGYWVDAQITTEDNGNGDTDFIVSYVLIYSKGDVIRKIEGSDILI